MLSCSPYIRTIISKSASHKDVYTRISPILFDVSLRDGIQGANPLDWPTTRKLDVFNTIATKYQPQSMEIGSLCSYKILPIMADTKEVYSHAIARFKCENIRENLAEYPQKKSAYVLIPAVSKLQIAINYGMTHLSFITSASNIFQVKNTNLTLPQIKSQFTQAFEILNGEPDSEKYVKKLYISCINECPISGKIDNDFVINEILSYNTKFSFDELCLSDTCGTLQYDDFVYIIDNIHFFGVPLSRISLHLHVANSAQGIENLEHILRHCFRKGISKFDISMIETGGCSVTMRKEQMVSNMTYEQFYKILYKHIDSVVENNNV